MIVRKVRQWSEKYEVWTTVRQIAKSPYDCSWLEVFIDEMSENKKSRTWRSSWWEWEGRADVIIAVMKQTERMRQSVTEFLNISKRTGNAQWANVKKIVGNTYVASSWSSDALVSRHPKTFCHRHEFVASGLQPLNSVRYDLMTAKKKRFRGCNLSGELLFHLRSSFCCKK